MTAINYNTTDFITNYARQRASLGDKIYTKALEYLRKEYNTMPTTTSGKFGFSYIHDLGDRPVSVWNLSGNLDMNVIEPGEIHLIYNNLLPRRIIKNPEKNAITVLWNDGDKTIVRRSPDDPDDNYFAIASAMAIKVYGSNSAFKRDIEKRLEILDKPHKLPMWTDFQ